MTRYLTQFVASFTILTVPAPVAFAQYVRFSGPSDYDLAQQNPQQAAAADFDRDGNLDLVVTCEGHNQGRVSVLFGDGAADFGSELSLVHYLATGLAVADLDGDGWDDIAVTSAGWAQHGVRIFFNDRVGGFVAGAQLSTLGSPPVALATGDFDGDGLLDLAAACSSGGNAVDWFRGLGAGAFSGFQTVPGTGGLIGRRIAAFDADGDGLEELVLAHQTGLLLLRNTGSGSSRFTPVPAFSGSGGTQDVDVADMDRDGVLDVVALGSSGSVRLWHGDGLGAFYAHPGAQVPGGAYDLTLIDLDGNGSRDAFVTTLSGIELLFNAGTGSLAWPQHIASGFQSVCGAAGDWDGDGRTDLAVACNNGALDAYVSVHVQLPGLFPATSSGRGPSLPSTHVNR